jgi:TIR domain
MDPLIFLSYSSRDKLIADAICSRLENQGIRCWIAPRDVNPGSDYSDQISEALERSTAMVMVFSSGSNSSRHVKSEIDRAFSLDKVIIPFRVENVEMDKGLAYYLSKTHWLDALTRPLEQHIDRLAGTIRKVSGLDGSPTFPPPPTIQLPTAAVQPRASRGPWIIAGLAVLVCGLLLVSGLLFFWVSRTKRDKILTSASPSSTAPAQKQGTPSPAPADVLESMEVATTPRRPDRDPFAGRWKITEAATIAGVPYDGTVEITSSGPRYQVRWRLAANTVNGLALPLESQLCVAYGPGDVSVIIYKISPDGALKGRWAYSNFSANDRDGLENVVAGDDASKIEGVHAVKGLNPDGTSYQGTLTISKTGQTYQLEWEILGRLIKGIAIKVDDTLFAASAYEGSFGVVSYAFAGSKATGVWTTSGESKLGTEALAK